MMEITSSIISKLKFIGQIKKGEKINVKHQFVQSDGFMTSFLRTFVNHDTRDNALTFITDTIKHSFEIISSYLPKCYKNLKKMTRCVNIIRDLQNAQMGILNLKKTYADDTMFCCKIETLNQEISAKISEIRHKYLIVMENVDNIDEEIIINYDDDEMHKKID